MANRSEIFTVDDFTDSIRKRRAADVEKQLRCGKGINTFENREQAIVFVVYRAQERVADAKKKLRSELARQRKAQKLASRAWAVGDGR